MSRLAKSTNGTDQKGFTILELLIATMVFSVIFLATTTALIQIGKLYYKGVVSGRTQELSRSLTDQISQQLQFGANTVVPGASLTVMLPGGTEPGGKLTYQALCIGNTRYTYRLDAQVSPGSTPASGAYDAANSRLRHALWRDSIPNPSVCNAVDLSQTTPSSGGEEVLSPSTRLSQFVASCNDVSQICTVKIGIIYGDNNLLTPDPTAATTNPATLKCDNVVGSQWCAGTQLTTTVLKRVGAN